MSTFGGIQTALSGLMANQYGVDTATNNVANANTPGYHRQVANFTEGPAFPAPGMSAVGPGQIGEGVVVTGVQRMIDPYVMNSLQSQLSQQGAANVQQQATSQVAGVFNDLSQNGIANQLDQFWGAWGNVANAPTDLGVRSALVSNAQTLASTIQQTYGQLQSQQQSLNQQVGQQVTTLNSLTSQVANLNQQIVQVQASGMQPNDLLDQRDQLIGQISGIAQVNVATEPNGAVRITLDGSPIVDGNTATALTAATGSSGWLQVQAPDGTVLQPTSGSLAALESTRDTQIPQYMSQLNDFANRLITAVNSVQEGIDPTTGATVNNVYNLATPGTPSRIPFFTGTGAADIAVNSAVAGNPALIAASKTPNGTGDGSIAQAIADLQNDPTAGGAAPGGPTLDAQYQSLTVTVGNDANSAQANATDQATLVQHLQQLDAQIGGVSLNQEAADLTTYQNAYQACAKVLSVFDSMLNTLINQTGIGG